MSRVLYALVFVCLLVATIGCGKEGGAQPNGPQGNGGSTGIQGLKDLKTIDSVVGKGPTAEPGDQVFVTYTGKLKNGATFDSNDKPTANPLGFMLGQGGVIKGWDQGIVGMRVGGSRRLEVPARLAYGSQSPPGSTIPPNSDLYFDVKLLDLVKKGEENIFDKTDLKVGSGPTVENGDTVTVNYVAKLVNGRRFDSTIERKKPETFILGKGDVIRGLEVGLIGMKQGGKRKLRIPPNIGYGSYGIGGVPPGSITIFEVDLLKVQKG